MSIPLKAVDCEDFGFSIGFVNPVDKKLSEETRANACLISAAPELLSCLLDVLDADGDLYVMDFDRYRAAIAKATGENQ